MSDQTDQLFPTYPEMRRVADYEMTIRSERELAWPSPANWPESIRSLRQWLIFHLILGVLVGLYDLILVISCLLDRSYTYLTNYPKWWMTVLGTLCCIFSFSLASRDAVFWAQGVASNDGSFKPEFLGGL